MMDGSILWQGILAGAGRSIVGWLKKAVQKESDGGEMITDFEWKQLVTSISVVFVSSLVAYWGLSSVFDFDVNTLSLGIGLIVNELWSAIFKK